jgi:hypothetical protein
MPTATCLINIQSEEPPDNVPCTDNFCTKVSYQQGKHCTQRHKPVDTPVSSYDPDLHGPGIGGSCWCCCSCFADNTPIEVTPGEFVLIQDINDGDTILAGGKSLEWKPTKVKVRSGNISRVIVPHLYLVKYRYEQEPQPREIIVTADHLFMMSTSRTLKAVQHLIPGDTLTTKDGNPAEVLFVAIGEHETAIQSIQMEGEFDGVNLDGHLLNANGIVTTDYAVQLYYEQQKLHDSHTYKFSDDDEVYEVGERQYIVRFECQALEAFLDEETAWPKGFMPKRKSLVNVPCNAASFLTPAQAQDIRDNALFNSLTNASPRIKILKLFDVNRAFHPKTICLLDWYNHEPNAYAWSQQGQDFILITGGLARVQRIYSEGFSLILSVMQAHIDGAQSVGEADYSGMEEEMRTTWDDHLYRVIVPKAMEQIRLLFRYISDDNAAGDPQDVLNNPSIECRLQTYQNAIGFLGIPDCAKTPPDYLEVLRATVSHDLKEVAVFYDDPVDVGTATTTNNYFISDGVTIIDAQVVPNDNKQVKLRVIGLEPASKYLLSVSNVVSSSGSPLHSQKDTVILKTPKAS